MASEVDLSMATDIYGHQALFDKLFNEGDADAVNAIYTADAVSEWDPGTPLTGQARRDRVAEFLSYGPKLVADVKRAVVNGDIAMVVVEWVIDTHDADGNPEHLEGVAVDVLKKGDDGTWRYVIDDPFAVSNIYDVSDQRTIVSEPA